MNPEMRGEYIHTVPNPKGQTGYRPGRKTAHHQDTKRKRKGAGSGPRP